MNSRIATQLTTHRADLMSRLDAVRQYDIVVIGGGATGLGVALDAAVRGLRVVLIDSHDFSSGTSSRSTKLVHGGVRYLAQGNIALVQEALRERKFVLDNAPYLAQPLAFVMPTYHWWGVPFYGSGLKMYDMLAGRAGLGKTELLGRQKTLDYLPALRKQGLSGGVKYWDGQFNDARLALALARTAATHGALLINYCKATGLLYDNEKIAGVTCEDQLTGKVYQLRSRCVVNATGVWVDALRQKDGRVSHAHDGHKTTSMVSPSQGVHLVVDKEFLGSDVALMIPKTADGRILFAVPWLGKVILGTTDTPRQDLAREPLAFDHEIEFILREAAHYLRRAPTLADVKSVWVGLRPLVKPPQDEGVSTKAFSREHTILTSHSGMMTVTGGKWTTYRSMAEDVLEKCEQNDLIALTCRGLTKSLRLTGATETSQAMFSLALPPGWHSYGDEQAFVKTLPGAEHEICAGLTEAMVRFAARYEYAINVEDVLARRSRLLFLDARLAAKVAPVVGEILAQETGIDPRAMAFQLLAKQYFPNCIKNV
jgi:glycerol-3-phosphate dehydrogenase